MIYSDTMTKHVSKVLVGIVLVLVALVLVIMSPLYGSASAQGFWEKAVPETQAEIELSYAPLVKQVSPAVVNIYTKKTVQRRLSMRERMYGRQQGGSDSRSVQNSLGSGVIMGQDGVIVTNNHVIEGADEIIIVLSDRREYPAELILADERTDLAVLRIDTDGAPLPKLGYADTRGVEVGDLVLAVGNPFGVGQTVTTGIISATARTDVGVSDYAFFLQTDAAVNPGNSGGALVNTRGDLVGINTAIFSRSGGSNGIGFAIPSEMVKRVVDAAVNEGTIVRPWLGLKGQSVTFDIAKAQGLDRPLGVIVSEVYEDGPADLAGLRRGDLVLTIDDREVFDERGLKFLAATKSPGEDVALNVLRGGSEQIINARLAPPPGASEAERILLDGRHPFAGVEVVELSPRLAEEIGYSDSFASGVLVTRMSRRAYRMRIVQPRDIITSIDGQSIETIEDLNRALDRDPGRWDIEIERNGRKISGSVTI
ncbi:MAG: Do family serine endopeptidase [Pseudomonadota bacterium]